MIDDDTFSKMPADTKRLTGPDNTICYRLHSKAPKSYDEHLNELFKRKRKDGRKLDDHRLMYVKCGVVSQAKGSAYLELNNTKLLCSVFDPREIPNHNEFCVNGELYCEFKYATFACMKRRGFQRDAEEKELGVNLRRALEPAVCRHEFPNFQVDIYVLVLENDGSALAAAITAASIALADAGVPMYDLVTAVTMGVHGEYKITDLIAEEEAFCTAVLPDSVSLKNHGIITLAYMATLDQVAEVVQSGSMQLDCILDCIQQLMKPVNDLYKFSQSTLVVRVTKTLSKKKKENAQMDVVNAA